ncbi:hypothetical protein [uncultured Bacteroides sp.]|uniref:hypothetical protein n=1 Tax=uncultured Bacteroides sp. TaxID=162156 RepID=UPI00280A8B0D|nr:hypothetical protein [uncultured Bacteroides sp.]
MNYLNKIFLFLFIGTMMLLASCSPDEYGLGNTDVKPADLVEGIAYKIEHDAANPNIVYLKSLMGSKYTPLWSHPQGRSQEQTVTLKMPFAGTYNVVFGVETRGGVVYGDTATFKIDDMYAEFVSDPMWTKVAGGAGKSKTWYLDLDADATSRYFLGPIYFFTNTYTWDNLHNAAGDNYLDADAWDATKAITPNLSETGTATWYWLADYPGNSWMCDAADFGSMTFDLIGGANITVDQEAYGLGKSTGSYMLDVDKHTITFSDAYPVHDSNRDAEMKAATEFRILYLTDDAMQIMVVPSGACYNFISKEYKDNWVPGEVADPEPALPDGWKDDISQTVNKSITWKLSETNPLDWCNLDGSRMNGWNSPADYPSWLGTLDASVYKNFSMTLNSDDLTANFVAPDGTKTACNYTLDEKGIYTFSTDSTENTKIPSFAVIGWANFSADSNRQLRIMSIEKDATGAVTGMWLGAKDAVKPEYTAYHLVPSAGSSTTTDPLKAWKTALIGKTFTPDTGWFVDWLNFDLTGGWTSASTFGTDFTSNNWVWDEATSNIAKSATLKFEANGDDIKVTLIQNLTDAEGNVTNGYTVTGKVTINPDAPSMKFEFPLVNYTGGAGAWLNSANPKGAHWTTALSEYEWIFISHGGSNLSNINTNGFWLGAVANATAAGDSKDEVLAFHYILKQ